MAPSGQHDDMPVLVEGIRSPNFNMPLHMYLVEPSAIAPASSTDRHVVREPTLRRQPIITWGDAPRTAATRQEPRQEMFWFPPFPNPGTPAHRKLRMKRLIDNVKNGVLTSYKVVLKKPVKCAKNALQRGWGFVRTQLRRNKDTTMKGKTAEHQPRSESAELRRRMERHTTEDCGWNTDSSSDYSYRATHELIARISSSENRCRAICEFSVRRQSRG